MPLAARGIQCRGFVPMTDPIEIPTDPTALRDWLRGLKQTSGASYAAIAQAIGEEERTVKRWMTSDAPTVPRGDALLRLLDFFGVVMTPSPPASIAASLTGELRALREEITAVRDRNRALHDADSQTDTDRVLARLRALEAKVDGAAQDAAEALARLAAGIDELSARLPGAEPGTQRRARPR